MQSLKWLIALSPLIGSASEANANQSARKPDVSLYGKKTNSAGYEHVQDIKENEAKNIILFFGQEHQWSLSDDYDSMRFQLKYRLLVDFNDDESKDQIDQDNVDKLIAFMEKPYGNYKLSVGLQEVTWGENLLMPILDLVNPRDLNDPKGYYDPEAKKSTPMINMEWVDSIFNAQLIYVPYPAQTIHPDEVEDFGVEDQRKYEFFYDAEYGARLGFLLEGVDTKFYYYKHWPRVPSYRFLPFSSENDILIEEDMVETKGISSSYAGFNWVLRLDLADHQNYPATNIASKVERTNLRQGILGYNWTTDSQQSIGTEFHFDRWRKAPIAYTEGAWVRDNNEVKNLNWLGFTGNFNFLNYLIEPQFFYLRGISNSDQMLRAIILWNTADNLTIAGEYQNTNAETTSPKLLLNKRESAMARITFKW